MKPRLAVCGDCGKRRQCVPARVPESPPSTVTLTQRSGPKRQTVTILTTHERLVCRPCLYEYDDLYVVRGPR